MESHYSVGVSNRFSLFYEDDDNPGDAVEPAAKEAREKSLKEEKKAAVIITGGKSKDNKEKQQQQTTEGQTGTKKISSSDVTSKGGPGKGEKPRFSRNNEQDNRRRDGPQANRDGAVNNKTSRFGEQRRNRPPPRDKDEVFQSGSVGSREDKPTNFREGRINSRGSSRGRGTRGAFRGKREFDRRSGSDRSSIKPVEKREGSGGYNWGTVHDDLNAISPDEEWPNDESENISNGISESTTAEPTDSEKPAAASQQTISEQKSEPPGVVEMTLDEYKAKMVVSRSKPQYQERTLHDTVSGDQWKDSIVFSRNEDEYIPSQREVIEKIKTSGRKVTPVEVSIHFKDPARRGRGRTAGVPTGFRGTQDRRSGNLRRDRAPNMTDPDDFPALNS